MKRGLTQKEKRACWAHAKDHATEAIKDALVDEGHTIMRVDGKVRLDMQQQTMDYLQKILTANRRLRFPK